jgi:hypothetical protein
VVGVVAEGTRFSKMSVLTRATRRNISEDGILPTVYICSN